MHSDITVKDSPVVMMDPGVLLKEDISKDMQLDYAFANGVRNFVIFIEAQSGSLPRSKPRQLRDDIVGKVSHHVHITSMRFTRQNKLVFETTSLDCAKELVVLQNILDIPVSTYIQVENITSKFAIHNIDISISLSDLGTELQIANDFKIKELRRFTRKTTSGFQPTETILVTIFGVVVPPEVRFFYMLERVRPFYDRPRQCSKCWRFDHVVSRCKYDVRCPRCAGKHLAASCDSMTISCGNCQGTHEITDAGCPSRLRELQILKYKTDNHVTISEARRGFRSTTHGSFASAVKASSPPLIPNVSLDNWESQFQKFLTSAQETFTLMIHEFQQQLQQVVQQVLCSLLPVLKGVTLPAQDVESSGQSSTASKQKAPRSSKTQPPKKQCTNEIMNKYLAELMKNSPGDLDMGFS